MRNTRHITRLITILPILLLVLGSVAYIVRVGRELASQLPKTLSTEISARMNGKITFGRVEVHPLGVIVKDISITGQDEANPGPIIQIPQVKIACRLRDVITGKCDPATSIKRIEVLQPTIHLDRAANGRWNVMGLLKPMPAKKTVFSGKVFIRSARIILRDRKPDPTKLFVNTLSEVNAIVDFTAQNPVKFSAWGKSDPRRLPQFSANGSYDTAAHALKTVLNISNGDVAYCTKYPWRAGVNVQSGKADGIVTIIKTPEDRRIRFSADISVRDAVIRFRQLSRPVNGITGKVYLRNNRADMDLDGLVGSSPVRISGNIADFKHPQVHLGIASDRANLREVARLAGYSARLKQVSLPTSGRVRALVSGPTKSLRVGFEVTAPSVSWKEFTGKSASAVGVYSPGHIQVRRASVSACGGRLEASGAIDISKSPRADITGYAVGLRSNSIPMLAKHRLGIISSGDFQLAMSAGDVDLRYQGDAGHFSFHGFRFDQGRIDISYANGRTTINEASTHLLDGLVSLSGHIERNGTLDLDASGAGINMARVRDMFWKPVTVGRGEFQGKITGKMDAPVFDGEVIAQKMVVSGVGIERIEGNVTASRNEVLINHLTAYRYPGTITASGYIRNPFAKVPVVDISAKADSLDLGGISEAYGRYIPEGGRLTGEVVVSGNLRDPAVKGDLQMLGGVLQDIPIDTVRFRGEYSASNANIEEFSIKSGDSSFLLNGDLSGDGRIAAKFESDRLEIGKLSGLFGRYVSASGDAKLTGNIGGTTENPTLELSASCENPIINERTFRGLGFNVLYRDGVVSVTDAVLSDATARYDIRSMDYDTAARTAKLDARIENGRLDKLMSIIQAAPAISGSDGDAIRDFLGRFPKPISGNVNAGMTGSVEFTDGGAVPDLQADVSLADMTFGDKAFQSVTLKGSWKGDVARIQRLEAADEDMRLSAEGSFGPDEALSLNLKARGVNVATIRQWLDLSQNISGKADVTLVASGTTHAPSSEMNLEITDPTFGGAKFDRLKCRLVLAANETDSPTESRINIGDLTLSLGERNLRVSGFIPLERRSFTVAQDSPLLMSASLDSESLAILSQFTHVTMETGSSGEFKGLVKLAGTVRAPLLEGQLNWSEGKVQLPKINSPLEGITAKLSLLGDKVTVEELTGRSAEGGTFGITGDISFAGFEPSLNLVAKTNDLRVSGRNFSNTFGEDVRARLQGDLRITDKWRTPYIVGTVDIPDGSIALPRKPLKRKPSALASGFDPRFGVKVLVGENFRFGAARLKTPMMGKLSVMGSLSKPVVDGSMDVSGGTILFPMNRFKMMPGSTMTLRVGPNQQSSVNVDIRAQAKMTSVSVWGRPKRYTVTMTARGPMDRMNPEFTSSPPGLSQQQLLAMVSGTGEIESLFAKNGTNSLSDNLGGIFSTAVMPSVFEPISESFENGLGLEEFSIQMGYKEPLMLTIGQRLTENLYLDYTAAVGARPDYADSEYQLKLSYRWKHGLELGVQTDENRNVTLGVEGKLRF